MTIKKEQLSRFNRVEVISIDVLSHTYTHKKKKERKEREN